MKHKEEEKEHDSRHGVTRREFFTLVGAGTAGAAAVGMEKSEHAAEPVERGEMTRVNLLINERRHSLMVEPRWSLLYVIREKLGLTGTKVGCERGECGACTVLIDGLPRYACMTLAVEAEGSRITTLEGLMDGEETGLVQQAFMEHDAFQCGYCTPGQIVAVEGLLRANPHPSLEEIRTGLSGNLCRCGAYAHIFKAADRAAELKGTRGGGR